MNQINIIAIIIAIPLIVYSVILHEISHGFVAYLMGDMTAKASGRLSLNPVRHIDPFGTILLPILSVLAFGFGFGYAKPVPIDPRNFRDAETGMMFTGAAGPIANILIGTFLGLVVKFGLVTKGLFFQVFFLLVLANFLLAIFNLIPIPPLDGSRVLIHFLPARFKYFYYRLESFGFLLIFLLIFLAGNTFFGLLFKVLSPILRFFGF
ncbi:MAG: site-2 protease family protein [Actinobacteria bacterium]|nr:MAG: site-2 protease family protein [Actinomycetota bacterium]